MEQQSVSAFWSFPPADLLAQLESSPQGLSPGEAQRRLARLGANLLRPKGRTDSLTLLLAQYKSPIILILVFACILSFALGDQADALIILAILLVSGLLGFWQERGATNAVAKLLAIVQIKATVRRQGEPQEIPVEEIVPGDVVLLERRGRHPRRQPHPGVQGPVRGRGGPHRGDLSGGESGRRSWRPDTPLARRTNTLFMGTHVVSGTASGGGGPDRQRHRVRPGFGPTEAQAAGDGI